MDPLIVSDPWLWLDGLKSQFTICIRFAMERGCWQRGLMVCGAWWGWGGGAIGIQKATLMSCRLTPRFDTRRALEYPMLSDVRMQLRRSRQNRMFARQGSGQNSRAHPEGGRFRLVIRLCAHPSPSTSVCTIRTPRINPFAIRWTPRLSQTHTETSAFDDCLLRGSGHPVTTVHWL